MIYDTMAEWLRRVTRMQASSFKAYHMGSPAQVQVLLVSKFIFAIFLFGGFGVSFGV